MQSLAPIFDRLLETGSIPDVDVPHDARAQLQPLFDSGILRTKGDSIVAPSLAMLRACVAMRAGDGRQQEPLPLVSDVLIDTAAGALPDIPSEVLREALELVMRKLVEDPAAMSAVLREAARYHPTDIAEDLADVAMRLGRFSGNA